jgi:ribonuclease Z
LLVKPKEGAMKINGIEIKGRSVSGYATAIALPQYGLAFDCGIATHDAVLCENVAITHGHLDHFGGVARHAYIRGMTGMTHSQFLVPTWLVKHVHQTFKFWSAVQEARQAPYGVTAVTTDKRVKLGKGRFLRAFATDHRIKSQGYVLVEERKRLKPEFVGTNGRELGRLRQEGVEFDEHFEFPLVAFTGDTRAVLYDRVRLEAQVLIAECTFLDDGGVDVAEARKKGHTHITELAAKAHRLDGVGTLMLVHFSKRHNNRDIEQAIARLPKELREKTTFLPVAK